MVKCPSCGSDNPTHVSFCGRCGTSIPYLMRAAEEQEASGTQAQQPSPESIPMKKCEWCGELNKWTANYCTKCGNDPHAQAPSSDYLSDLPGMRRKRKSRLPVVAGALSIVAGALAIMQGVIYLLVDSAFVDVGGTVTMYLPLCGGLSLVLGVGGLVGGGMALQRKRFLHAQVGALLGMFGAGFVVGGFLGFIAVILLAASHNEFDI